MAQTPREAARQAFSYSGMTGLAANLALFGDADYLDIYLRIRDKMPGLTLWRFNHGRWDPVRSRREAILVTRGEAPGQIP